MDMDEMDMQGMEYGMEQDDMMDQEYGQQEGDHYDQEHDMGDGQMMEMDHYGGEYGDEDEESINFDANPDFAHMPKLDRMRKIRRDILRTINDLREAHGASRISIDPQANEAANEYAAFLMGNHEDEEKAQEICKGLHVTGAVVPLVGFAILEEDEDHQVSLTEQMMDAHGLLLELEYELKVLADPANSHIGIGFAYNKEQVKVVEIVTAKTIAVHNLAEDESQGIVVNGQVLDTKGVGLYAARIVALSKMTKDLKVVGPQNIQYNKQTGDFTLHMPGPVENAFYNNDDPRMIEFYIRRKQIDKIEYGVESNERINVNQGLELAYSIPMQYIPDPRTQIEDAQDLEKDARNRAIASKRAEEAAMVKKVEKEAKNEERKQQMEALQTGMQERKQGDGSDEEGSGSQSKKTRSKGGDSGESDDMNDGMGSSEEGFEEDEDSEESDDIAELPSQTEMKRDLITAIEEELREQDSLRRENEELQKQIIAIDSTFEQYDKQPDVQMNEHKYLNTLANVHQVRINLKETQDRYNKMASELQAKLNEKQAKCHEIEQQFKELKRSVAQNAVFSRTGKKIPKKTLEDWEDSESLKDQEVHQYRLQNIALRNRLANKEKILKKKEQLADGLHLIDFEQLKIENQTLNEKIEERNEELHKLRTKITSTVVILSHTREKLQYIQEQNRIHTIKHQDLTANLTADKHEQSRLKVSREALLKTNQKLKQQTGIVNKKELKTDFDARDIEITRLEEQIKILQVKHTRLTMVIEQANEIQMKRMAN